MSLCVSMAHGTLVITGCAAVRVGSAVGNDLRQITGTRSRHVALVVSGGVVLHFSELKAGREQDRAKIHYLQDELSLLSACLQPTLGRFLMNSASSVVRFPIVWNVVWVALWSCFLQADQRGQHLRWLDHACRHPQPQVPIAESSKRGDFFAESQQSGNFENIDVWWVASRAHNVVSYRTAQHEAQLGERPVFIRLGGFGDVRLLGRSCGPWTGECVCVWRANAQSVSKLLPWWTPSQHQSIP